MYEDYHNDIYVLTDEKIVDIERKPLALSKVTEEFYLDRVQNVKAKQRGIWANVLDYGDVTIQTAAADRGVTFLHCKASTVRATADLSEDRGAPA